MLYNFEAVYIYCVRRVEIAATLLSVFMVRSITLGDGSLPC
jgi:hypothetical protein